MDIQAGLVLAVDTRGGRFAALAFNADSVHSELSGAADKPDALRKLASLAEGVPVISDSPLRAQTLLNTAGVHTREVWDVLELSSLLVPASPRGLDLASEFFGLVVERTGVLGQAYRGLMLFQLLLSLLQRVDTQTLLHATRLAAGLEWPLRPLLMQALQSRAISPLESGTLAAGTPIGAWITQGGAGPRRRQSQVPDADPPPLEAEDVARRFAPDGGIARALPAFEARHEQVRMAHLVTETLNGGGQLLIEAGTGTGKSLAYLLPAALRAVTASRRVVVSTATTTLQDQLHGQDLPLVQAGLGAHMPLRATVLKGRANYLCLRRWQTLLHAGDLSVADRMLLIKTLFWLPQTSTGDRAELHLSAAEEEAWSRLSAVTEACTPQRCSYHRIGVCFLARARRAAEESHIVIANHALLLSDVASRNRVLPDYDVLIVDEAHHLEDEATQQLGWRLGERELLNRLERLWAGPSAGAVAEGLGILAHASGGLVEPGLKTTLEDAGHVAAELSATFRRFFEALARLLDDPELRTGNADEQTLRITAAVRAGSAWQELEQLWAEGVEALKTVERALIELSAELQGLPNAPEPASDLASELSGHLDYWREVRHRLNRCVHQPDGGAVFWISGGGRYRTAWLNAAPLETASILRERLFAEPEASILVSATLAIGDSFEYVKRRLGLEDARAEALGSPFDYASAALLFVPNDVPDPTQPGYQAQLERAIVDVVSQLGGRTLVLFTSRAHLRTTYQALREPLLRARITLLAQGVDESSRTRLLDSFRRGSRVVLFGTNAFWEGIDVVGEALSCVMVTRLPFAVPSDPIYAARSEHFDDPFGQYAVPQAVLRLKQGVGRLIRSRVDRGAVVVLDRRLVTRFYGQVFVRSLPPCTMRQGPAHRAGSEVGVWVAIGQPSTAGPLQLALAARESVGEVQPALLPT
jgi:predicted DnaQ family exonuclease/DinG family helicase